ncbi:MAG: helix-turn-helix domain-containing protein [Nitrobacter sp.]|uniref:helix-turn-helix domain-containing protein n=1 Tax=Nitrobacter sp. TaxID=29420 RepID=UPI00343E1A3C|nr:helix-turn-helix domain-containing protein [Nitrobacter sp.]
MRARDSRQSSPRPLSVSIDQSCSPGLVRLAYSVPEVAKLIGISKSKIWELIRSGELSSVKICGRRVVRHSDLLALLAGNRQ